MSSCTLLFIVLCIVWLRLRGGACRHLEARSQNSSNRTAHTNKVRDPFCKRKWFGINERARERFLMAVFTPEGQTSPRLNSPRLIIRPGAENFSGNIRHPQTLCYLWLWIFIYFQILNECLFEGPSAEAVSPEATPLGAFFGCWCFPEQRLGGSCWDGGTNAENISIWRWGVPEPEWKNSQITGKERGEIDDLARTDQSESIKDQEQSPGGSQSSTTKSRYETSPINVRKLLKT